jgi:molecular chaperone GrpE
VADASTESSAEESTDGADNEVPSTPSTSKEEQLEMEIKSLKDQLLRSLADQDNTRRIAQRDIEAARQFAIKSFAKSLLDVSDNLTRALEAVPKDELEQAKGTTLATLYEGIEMTERGLNKAFEMNGLVKYGAEGEPFDPNQHEALFEYPDSSKKPGTVGQVMKAGFMLNKRVLRPAEVGIVKNPE